MPSPPYISQTSPEEVQKGLVQEFADSAWHFYIDFCTSFQCPISQLVEHCYSGYSCIELLLSSSVLNVGGFIMTETS